VSHGEVQADGADLGPGDIDDAVGELLDALDAVDSDGWYPAINVVRPWSAHNPRITGEFARPGAIRRLWVPNRSSI
jgi:AMP nucleosidase